MRSVILSCAALVTLVGLGASARADEFLQQEGDLWRASKLVGVNIYGPENKKVGDINDVLMGHDGKASYVVVGVGGFLGIGEKNVAIPIDKVKFTQEPMPAPAGTMTPAATATAGGSAPATAPGAVPGNAGMAATNATGLGTPAPADGMGMATGVVAPSAGGMAAPVMPRSTAYPDHGTVDYTVEQLKAAPTFSYAK